MRTGRRVLAVLAALLFLSGVTVVWAAIVLIRGPACRHAVVALAGVALALIGLWLERHTRIEVPAEPPRKWRRVRRAIRFVRTPVPRILLAVSLVVLALFFGYLAVLSRRPGPPGQPATGPGGALYAHAAVRATVLGEGARKVWIFEPADPAPPNAPVIVFLHGWGAWWPAIYRQWIDHLVRRGNIVIYPKYQASWFTWPTQATANAQAAVRAALAELARPGHVEPDLERVAAIGHSLGAVIALNLAATAPDAHLPQPRAVMAVQPGDPPHAGVVARRLVKLPSILADLSRIPAGTLLLVVVGDRDIIVEDTTAKIIWSKVRHLSVTDRDYVTVRSDLHGYPWLVAGHISPVAPRRNSIVDWTKASTDALDYYGTWKLLDGLTDAAFYGKNRKYALGDTPEQRYMGKWSDGTPVRPLEVLPRQEPRTITEQLAALLGLATGRGPGSGAPRPPGQPRTGPGGAEYPHADLTSFTAGTGAEKAWVFEPAEPTVKTAPVVILLHGWGAWGPVVYKQWIHHLARRGNIVIHPKYQASLVSLPSQMTRNAAEGVHHALAELVKEGHTNPDLTRVAVAGHSLGAVIAANLAAGAKAAGLPQARAVLCVQPGDPRYVRFNKSLEKLDLQFKIVLRDLSPIPKGTLVLVVVSDRDRVAGDATAKIIWKGIGHLPAADRDYITVLSDLYGSPRLKALHVMAAAPSAGSIPDWTRAGTDALDYYGTWKLLDGLTDAAFHGKNRKYALGDTPEQRYMGKWSDGTPVKEMRVLKP